MMGNVVPVRIAVLMTCFNRRETTLRSLAALFGQRLSGAIRLTVFLVDDASTDGTSTSIRLEFPQVRLLQGDGSLFWNGGMHKAFAAALQVGFDAYLLLNDDTVLCEDALEPIVARSRQASASGRPAILVGNTLNPVSGSQSYGGIRKRIVGLSLALERVPASADDPVSCDTMNGNIALIPAAIAMAVGNLDERFRHQFGDLDYGLRARAAGFDVIAAPGYAGQCRVNSIAGTWRDASLPLQKRWRHLVSLKGVPFREWLLFTRRHFGFRWPIYAISPYVKTVVSSLIPRGGGARRSAVSLSREP